MSSSLESPKNNVYVKPSGLEVDFDKNITRLYEAITNSNWEEAIAAAKTSPNEARTWVVRHYDDEGDAGEQPEIMWRFLPIHSACAREPPATVVSALLHAYPDGAKCVDDQGMYALHYACGNQASREVIRLLLMSFPDAAKIKDPRGMLPIHYLACWGPSSVSVIDMVLVAHRDVATSVDADGNTPIDLAKEGDYPERAAVVAALTRWLQNSSSSTSNKSKTNSTKAIEKTASTGLSTKSVNAKGTIGMFSGNDSPKPFEQSGSNSSPSRNQRQLHVDTRDEKKDSNESSYDRMVSAQDMARVTNELNKMKSEHRSIETAWEERLLVQQNNWKMQMEALEAKCKDLQMEQDHSNRQIAELQSDIQEKDVELTTVKSQLEDAENALLKSNDERDGLRQTLADLTEQHDKFKKKSEMMGDRLGSLSASLMSMMDQQTVVLDTMKAREAQLAALSVLRRTKFQELVQLEQEETPAEKDLKTCLSRQTKEMEAISAVIAAVRQN